MPRTDPPRRRIDRDPIENEPGYASPGPWSVRGMLTLALCVVVLNIPVSAIVYFVFGLNHQKDQTFLFVLLQPSPFLFLLYALVCMPLARRLAQEPRRLRPLESMAAGALMYIVYFISISAAVQASGHNADAHDGKQMAGISVAALIGTFVGAALYPLVFRRFWMPRLPGSRGPRR
jgi:hypothetical protein